MVIDSNAGQPKKVNPGKRESLLQLEGTLQNSGPQQTML